MEAHLAPKEHIQVNKISSSCEICSGPHNTQYCMENLEEAFVDYTSSRTDEAAGLVSNLMASQDARLSKFEANFKKQQSEMTNKIDTVLKAITDRILGALPSDTVKNPKLNVNPTTLVLYARSYQMEDPQCSSYIHSSINVITLCPKQPNKPYNDELNEENNRRGVEYVMSKILGFYREGLELGPEYLTGVVDEGEVTCKGRDYGPTPNLLEEKHSESKDGVSSNNRRCLDLNETASEKSI
ncbi:hypothetical protein Tco_1495278 [Tanacetum coccineum]